VFRASTTLALDSHRSNYYLSTRIEFESGTYSESFMPRFDLRQDDGTLHPLASFKVLAVMCHPSNRVLREKMLGTTEKETGGLRPRRQPATAEMFMQEVRRTSRRAAVAGGLLLTMLQLDHSGRRASLNHAIPLVAALLPMWQQPLSPYWSKICHFEHRPRSKTTMLQAYNQFRTVAHFWGALLHGQLLGLACALPSFAGVRRFAVTRSEAWSFIIPQEVTPAMLSALPLNEEQLAILNEQERLKALA